MISETLQLLTQVGMLAFIVGGMAAMGLSLTVDRIVAPLRNVRFLIGLLVANFVVVPAVAVAVSRVLPMESEAAAALVIIGCVAGAPFLPRLAQLARGDAGLAVGAMVLLMVATIGFAPVVVPLLIQGATVDPWSIAQSLVVLMLIPLAIGLVVRARYPSLADGWAPSAAQASNVGLLLGIAAALLVSWRDILGSIGTWIFIGTAVLLVAALIVGWLAGIGRSSGDRTVMALATAQRNVAAGIVVATSIGGDTLVYTLVAGLLIPVVLIVLAGELGRRGGAAVPAA